MNKPARRNKHISAGRVSFLLVVHSMLVRPNNTTGISLCRAKRAATSQPSP